MVSKAKAVKGSSKGIDYIMKEEKNCYELCRNDLIGENGTEILAEMRETQAMNERCMNNTFSIVLSPNAEEELTREQLRTFTQKHLENLGLKENQYIAYVHQNTKATHVHIVSNRVDYCGKALDDSYIGFKAQNSAESIAKENGMTTAKEIRKELQLEREMAREESKEIRSEIYKAHNYSVKESKTFEGYISKMNEKGYEIQPSINKGGKLQGFKIHDKANDLSFKASEIHRNCGIKTMVEKGIDFKGLEMQKQITKGLTKEIATQPVQLISNLQPYVKAFELVAKIGSKIMDQGKAKDGGMSI